MKYIFVSCVDMHIIYMFLHLINCTAKCEINTYYYYYIIIIIDLNSNGTSEKLRYIRVFDI